MNTQTKTPAQVLDTLRETARDLGETAYGYEWPRSPRLDKRLLKIGDARPEHEMQVLIKAWFEGWDQAQRTGPIAGELPDIHQFTGTTKFHRWSMLFGNWVLTDGALHVAEKYGAFWLMDLIASYMQKKAVRDEVFQVWELTVNRDQTAFIKCTGAGDEPLAVQEIPFTDFPACIKLYASYDGRYWTILLPSEY